jgi:hypothetical protein
MGSGRSLVRWTVRWGMVPLNPRLEMVGIIWLATMACLNFKTFDEMFDTVWAGCEPPSLLPATPSIASQEPRS